MIICSCGAGNSDVSNKIEKEKKRYQREMHHLFSARLNPAQFKAKHLAARIRTIYRPTGSYSASQFLFLHFLKDGLVYNIHEKFHNMGSRKCGAEIFIGKSNS